MVSVSEALDLIHAHVTAVSTQIVPLEEAPGRVCAERLFARYDLPRFDNSAMDGYAVTMADAGAVIHAQPTLYAGDACEVKVQKGLGVRIMTGAMMPEGADAVIPIEETEQTDEGVRLPDTIRRGANIKKRGEDVAKGDLVVERGDEISAYTVGLLASQGVTHLTVYRRPRVTVFATGHELRMHFERVEAHQIYNSNAPTAVARAAELGCEALFSGATADTLESIKAHIESALGSDLIVTSGGISVGDADYTLQAFEELGMQTLFHKVEIKPGKPTTLGRIGKTWVLNLPGNPAAAAVNFELFGRSIVHRLRGLNAPYLAPITTKNARDYRVKKGRPTVLIGKFDGERFEILQKQGPGMVRPMSEADGFIVTDGVVSDLEAGHTVRMIPLRGELRAREAVEIFTV
ncbi:molybdopterin molybdotransferase MoeA [Hydrogenimonas sp.]